MSMPYLRNRQVRSHTSHKIHLAQLVIQGLENGGRSEINHLGCKMWPYVGISPMPIRRL